MSGISYLSREQEGEAIRSLDSTYGGETSDEDPWGSVENVRDMPSLSMADVLFTERMKSRFSEWRDELLREKSGNDEIPGFSKDSKQQLQVIFFKMRPALQLHGFTSHQLKMIKLVRWFYLVPLVHRITLSHMF